MKDKKILITGVAGFIGSFLAKTILEQQLCNKIIGIDNLNDYYDVELKRERLQMLEEFEKFIFVKGDITDANLLKDIFEKYKPQVVINLAAQAGVRYSIENPRVYMESNVMGFFNILECCRESYKNDAPGVEHLIYASSSSVYGGNKKIPYSVEDQVDRPVSLYAATKKSDELMAYAYSRLYGIPSTGVRFFTVYGPMGRPDMAYFSFASKMVNNEKIQIYNYGDMYRDFTFIDDIVNGMMNIMEEIPQKDEDGVRYKIYNIGNNKPEKLIYFVETLERCLMEEGIIRQPVEKEFLPMQPGDVYQTYADIKELKRDFDFEPNTDLDVGLKKFAKWYKVYLKRQV